LPQQFFALFAECQNPGIQRTSMIEFFYGRLSSAQQGVQQDALQPGVGVAFAFYGGQ